MDRISTGVVPPSRWLRLALASVLLAALLPGIPARADYAVCAAVWESQSAWAEEEATSGLTIDRLDQLEPMLPLLAECDDYTVGRLGRVGRWASLVVRYFPPHDVDRVLCLMAKESGGNPWARNPTSGASGLMQVMPFWAGSFGVSRSALFDPEVNLWIASEIKAEQGWWAWSPYQRGACR